MRVRACPSSCPRPAPRPAALATARSTATSIRASVGARVPALLLGAALALGTAAAHPQAGAPLRLPALGDAGAEDLPLAAERRLGEQIVRELRRDPAWLEDPLLDGHVGALWARLLAAARQRGDLDPDLDRAFAWETFLVRDGAVNAFALPGGFVGLHLGLIASTASADELASVLAHELAHVTQRHIARGLARAQRDGAVGLAAMLLGVLVASRAHNPDMAQAAIAGGQAALIQGQLNFSREMEREADRIGWGVFSDAGFAAGGMASMFDLLERASRLNDSGGFPYLRSHPLTVDRLAEARARLPLEGTAPSPDTSAPAPLTPHTLLRARATVLMNPSTVAWQALIDRAGPTASPPASPLSVAPAAAETPAPASRAADGGPDAGTLYAAALAAALLGDHARAGRLAEALWHRVSVPEGAVPSAEAAAPAVVAALLQAELGLRRGETAAGPQVGAWLRRADALAAAPPGQGWLGRARLMAHAERAWRLASVASAPAAASPPGETAVREALARLRPWVATHPGDPLAWEWIGRLEQQAGQTLRAMRALAEAQAARGDLDGAIDRLQAAQAAARSGRPDVRQDFIEASIIDARLGVWRARRIEAAGGARAPGTGSR